MDTKKKLGIGAIIVVIGLLTFFIQTSRFEAGESFEAAETFTQDSQENKFVFYKDNRAEIIVTNEAVKNSITMSVQLVENGENGYVIDTGQGVDIRMFMSHQFAEEFAEDPMNAPFEIIYHGNRTTITGHLTEEQAREADLNLEELVIERRGEDLLIDDELFIILKN